MILDDAQRATLAAELADPIYEGLDDDQALAVLAAPGPDSDPVAITDYPSIKLLSSICLAAGLIGRCDVYLRTLGPSADEQALELAALCASTLAMLRGEYRLDVADVLDPKFQLGLETFEDLGWVDAQFIPTVTALQTTTVIPGRPGPSRFRALRLGVGAHSEGGLVEVPTLAMIAEARSL